MAADENLKPGPFLARWIFANLSGWMFGVFAVALLAVLSEALRLNGETCVGLGMGLTIGFFQWRLARKQLHVSSQWMWSLTLCMTIAFLVLDFFPANWHGKDILKLQIGAGAGGLLAGVWQSRMLPKRRNVRAWFVAASTVGWLLAASLPALASIDPTNRVLNAIGVTSGLLLGGAILGLVTGPALMRLQVDAIGSVSPDIAGAAD
jgi:hypothetical protein